MTVFFTVPGEPKGKARPKFTTYSGHARAITPKETAVYENLVKTVYATSCGSARFPDDAQIDIKVYAFYAIPKSVSKKKRKQMIDGIIRPTKKPDWDNIGKIIADALNNIAYKDDSQIVDALVRKYYSENPRVEVYISTSEIKEDT